MTQSFREISGIGLRDHFFEECMSHKRTLLAVLAHPDDESFGTGGTLALYASQGVDVYLICATRGEVGEMPDDMLAGYATIGDKREAELRCAAKTLGIRSVYFLGYRDSGMPGTPDNHHPQALAAQSVETVAKEVARHIRTLKPDIVITFDPIGGYYHPDHIAIHRATVMAFDLAGDPEEVVDKLEPFRPHKLYFQTMPRTFLRLAVRLYRLLGKDPRRFGANQDIDMVAISEVDFPISTRINCRKVAHIRDAAAACHASQGGTSMVKGLVGWVRKQFGSVEEYMRAFPPASPGEIEADLFCGLE